MHAVVRQLLHTVQLPSNRAFHVQLVHDPSNITLQPCILTWQCFLHPQVSENSCELWQQKKVIIFLSLDVMQTCGSNLAYSLYTFVCRLTRLFSVQNFSCGQQCVATPLPVYFQSFSQALHDQSVATGATWANQNCRDQLYISEKKIAKSSGTPMIHCPMSSDASSSN